MDSYREYFPTKAYRIAEMRLATLLRNERDRLDQLAESLHRESAIGQDNLPQELPHILAFTKAYHEAFSGYLAAILPQQPRPIQCRPACGNCCHHYPMSVEPFELIYLYNELRKGDDLLSIMESCQLRASHFEKLYESNKQQGVNASDEEDDFDEHAEDEALHQYFASWISCPFSNKVGDCTVYPFRPVSCRMYFSETDPKFCTPEHLRTENNDSYIVYLPDHIEDAVYGISEHYDLLNLSESYFGGLLAVNRFEGLLNSGGAGK